jgi:hypothetical protein
MEDPVHRTDLSVLRSLLVSFAFEMLGIREMYRDLHHDFVAFKRGFMLELPSSIENPGYEAVCDSYKLKLIFITDKIYQGMA